jgi:DNA-directed RNA polymerase subunit RPC12/RpoP
MTEELFKYLKPRQEYIDRYDHGTVYQCRHLKKTFQETLKEMLTNPEVNKEKEKDEKEILRTVNAMYRVTLYFAVGDRYMEREETVRHWMEKDERKDRLLAEAPIPHSRCSACGGTMRCEHKHISSDINDERIRVLFIIECNSCGKREALYDDGERFYIHCEKCDAEVESSDTREGDVLTTINTCPKCGHKSMVVIDFAEKPKVIEEKEDPKRYEADKEDFGMNDEKALAQYPAEKERARQIGEMTDKWKRKEKEKDIYDAVAKLKKLTIMDLENLLRSPIEKASYVKFEIGKPMIGRDVTIDFSGQDAKPGRQEYDSIHDLQKLIKGLLENTNWRLMSDGISYRLGFLTGRLHAYEKEEDLVELMRVKMKKEEKQTSKK